MRKQSKVTLKTDKQRYQESMIKKEEEEQYQKSMIKKLEDDYNIAGGEMNDDMSSPPYYIGRILNRHGVFAKIFKDHRGQYYSRVDEKVTFLGDTIHVPADYRTTKRRFNWMIIDKYRP